MEASDTCIENGIELYCLLEHSSHIIQPLDLRFFGSLKAAWRQSVRDWQAEHIGEFVTKQTFARVLKPAWEASATVDAAVKGFRDAGLFPFSPSVVVDSVKLDPSQLFSKPTLSSSDSSPPKGLINEHVVQISSVPSVDAGPYSPSTASTHMVIDPIPSNPSFAITPPRTSIIQTSSSPSTAPTQPNPSRAPTPPSSSITLTPPSPSLVETPQNTSMLSSPTNLLVAPVPPNASAAKTQGVLSTTPTSPGTYIVQSPLVPSIASVIVVPSTVQTQAGSHVSDMITNTLSPNPHDITMNESQVKIANRPTSPNTLGNLNTNDTKKQSPFSKFLSFPKSKAEKPKSKRMIMPKAITGSKYRSLLKEKREKQAKEEQEKLERKKAREEKKLKREEELRAKRELQAKKREEREKKKQEALEKKKGRQELEERIMKDIEASSDDEVTIEAGKCFSCDLEYDNFIECSNCYKRFHPACADLETQMICDELPFECKYC